ncbi:hypothetical protein [Endozoicomonas sp.]
MSLILPRSRVSSVFQFNAMSGPGSSLKARAQRKEDDLLIPGVAGQRL